MILKQLMFGLVAMVALKSLTIMASDNPTFTFRIKNHGNPEMALQEDPTFSEDLFDRLPELHANAPVL